MGVLGVPRQGERRERLPLSDWPEQPTSKAPPEAPRPLRERLLWFVLLWCGGLAAVTLVSYGLRLWIAPK
jgi:hypothetical protein